MNSKTNFQKYICVDPSFFTSTKRFDSLTPVLKNLKKVGSKIVISTFLKPLFPNLDDEHQVRVLDGNQNEMDDVNSEIVNLLQQWNPLFNKKSNDDYQTLRLKVKDFAKTFFSNLVFADELVEGFLKNRSPPIPLTDIIKKLGKKGKTIFDFIVIGSNGGITISYGTKPISFLPKIEVPQWQGTSKVKRTMIEDGIAPKTLKIIAFLVSSLALHDFVNFFEILNFPNIGINEQDVFDVPLAIIADG